MSRYKCILFLALFSLFPLQSYSNMFNFFKPYKIMVSPSISGVVLKQGEPVANMEISLLAGLNDYYDRSTATDNNGYFHFDEIIHRQWFKPSSINTNLIGIEINANFNGNRLLLWSSHTGLDLHDYVLDNLNNLECDIDEMAFEYHFKNRVVPKGRSHTVFGVCRLKGYEEKVLREDL
ncbi:DUF4198 domain-containing protein [Vibrio cincinnatiensis]|uniref:DUF4198 domain-containing protein n=1 Tax=Vibrio cincinnatiensis TaxID=675 RepID=UPI001E507674|nr:DUF4198 domain-containing protein [Vibrio cincinnatiensis]